MQEKHQAKHNVGDILYVMRPKLGLCQVEIVRVHTTQYNEIYYIIQGNPGYRGTIAENQVGTTFFTTEEEARRMAQNGVQK